MKKALMIGGKIVLFSVVLLLILNILSLIFIPKWLDNDDNMYTWIRKGFYEEKKNSLDIIISGNSDVYRGVSPILLWDDYGITAYANSAPGQRIWTGYYMLAESLSYQNPKLVIFDMDSMFTTSQSSKGNYHKVFDNMKNNKYKWEAVNDEVFKFNLGNKISFYFPIFRYHDRYKELSKEDFSYAFKNYHFAYKGLDMITTRVAYNQGFDYMSDKGEMVKIPEKNKEYLDRIVELCKGKEIDLLLIELPSAASWSLANHEAIKAYAKENDLPFIDFNLNYEETGFDWLSDSSDGGDHLNVYGAEKITKYLGKYIKENYNFEDHRNEEEYQDWFLDSKKYHEDLRKLESSN